jgi:HEAT repeat protein/S1-C subfamily serine protease
MVSARPAADSDIYSHVLRSTVWIAVPMPGGGASFGSGSLIDVKNGLVLTNYHVVGKASHAAVLFPRYDDGGRPVMNRDTYVETLQKEKTNVPKSEVVARDEKVDLALIKLATVPEGVLPLAVADKGVTVGQTVHSVGNPRTGMWFYTKGTVRYLDPKKAWKAGDAGGGNVQNLESAVIITDSPTNPGDSGGPLVNDQGELVGVTHGFDPSSRGNSLFIDRTEVLQVVEGYCKSKGLTWEKSQRRLEVTTVVDGDVPSLVGELSDADPKTRARAAEMLGRMGPKAKLAAGDLGKLLKDPQELPRRMALEALAKLGPDARPAAPALVEALRDSDASIREEAARVLGKVGPDVKSQAFHGLAMALSDSVKGVRVAAAEALSNLGPLEPADLPVVLKVLKTGDPEARVSAARALGNFTAQAKEVAPELIEAYRKHSDPQLRRAVLMSLAGFGEQAKEVLTLLGEAFKSNNPELMKAASQAVAKLGPEAQSVVPELAARLEGAEPTTRKEMLAALQKVGPAAKEAVPALAKLLADKDHDTRLAALAVVETLPKDAKPAVPALIQLFTLEKEQESRVIAVLTKVGPDAVKELTVSLKDLDPWVRMGAVKTLGSLGPAAIRAARPLLILTQTDPTIEIRVEAQKAYNSVKR